MAVDRLLPTEDGPELVSLVREIAQAELAPRAAADEAAARFPRDAFAMLGEIGLLGLPYPEEYGGAGQPYEVYLQALEEVAMAWMSVGVGVSVHVMATYAMAAFGTAEQRASYLPEMISGQARSEAVKPRLFKPDIEAPSMPANGHAHANGYTNGNDSNGNSKEPVEEYSDGYTNGSGLVFEDLEDVKLELDNFDGYFRRIS